MKSKSKVPEEEKLALLPPCAICSSKSSGFHFGVNTCEACKAFFRRCLKRHKDVPLSCLGAGNCTIDIKDKALCPACRYEKCLKNGMSKSAIKTGRYSLERKADLIRDAIAHKDKTQVGPDNSATSPLAEASGIETMEMEDVDMGSIGILESTFSNAISISSDVSQHSAVLLPCLENCKKQPKQSSPALVAMLTSKLKISTASDSYQVTACSDPQPCYASLETQIPGYSPLTPASSPADHNINMISPKQNVLNAPQYILQTNTPVNTTNDIPQSINAETLTTKVGPNTTSLQEIDDIIQQVSTAYETYSPYTKDMKAKIGENQAQYKAEQEFFSDLFGPMKPLELEEYMEIYMNTGIDVDGRREFAANFFGHIDSLLTKLIAFVKCIPGFTDINIDDQIRLIRGGSIDWVLLTSSSAMNVENRLITTFFGMTFSVEELEKLHGEEMADVLFTMIQLIQELALDDTATALMAAVCITDPDQLIFQINNKEEVAGVQYNLIEALHLYLSRTCRRYLLVFNQAMTILNEMRKQRIRIHRHRCNAHGFCSKFGVQASPLMISIIEENATNNEKQIPLVQVLNEQRNEYKESDHQHMQL